MRFFFTFLSYLLIAFDLDGQEARNLPQPTLKILDTKFNVQNRSIAAHFAFLLPAEYGNECGFMFYFVPDRSSRMIEQFVKSIRQTNELIRGGVVLFDRKDFTPGETYTVKMEAQFCKDLIQKNGLIQLLTFRAPSCLEATNYDLVICEPPPPRDLDFEFLPESKLSNKTVVRLHWNVPEIPGLSHIPNKFQYEIKWNIIHVSDSTRSEISDHGFNKTNNTTTIVQLLNGFNYTFHISSVTATAGKGNSYTKMIWVPDPNSSTMGSLHDDHNGHYYSQATYLGTVLPLAVVVIIVVTALIVRACRRRRKSQAAKSESGTALTISIVTETMEASEFMPTVAPTAYNKSYDVLPTDDINLLFPFEQRISAKQLKDLTVIGKGSFGVIQRGNLYLYRDSRMPLAVAVKVAKDADEESEDYLSLLNEISLLSTMQRHRNVIGIIGYSLAPAPVMLILEFCENKDLRSYLQKQCSKIHSGPWRGRVAARSALPKILLSFATQIASGMDHLSKQNFIHRDLATRNILLTADMMVKISDFGLARQTNTFYKKLTPGRLPWKWLAPESLNMMQLTYSTKSDVWSFGVVLFELFSLGGDPYPEYTGAQLVEFQQRLADGERIPEPDYCHPAVYSIMQRCWSYLPDDRPSFETLERELNRLTDREADYVCLDFPGSDDDQEQDSNLSSNDEPRSSIDSLLQTHACG